jgi:hypothetical protein
VIDPAVKRQQATSALALTVESRRTQPRCTVRCRDRDWSCSSRASASSRRFSCFFVDGAVYPFQWFHYVSALLVLGPLAVLFVLAALVKPPEVLSP